MKSLSLIPNIYTIIKVHPRQSKLQFELLVKELSVRNIAIVDHCDLNMLLNSADLLICSASNINILAAQLKTPALVVTLNAKPYRVDFVSEKLCLGVNKNEELKSSIISLLYDDSRRKLSLDLAFSSISRFNGPNDGRSVLRIVGKLEEVFRATKMTS